MTFSFYGPALWTNWTSSSNKSTGYIQLSNSMQNTLQRQLNSLTPKYINQRTGNSKPPYTRSQLINSHTSTANHTIPIPAKKVSPTVKPSELKEYARTPWSSKYTPRSCQQNLLNEDTTSNWLRNKSTKPDTQTAWIYSKPKKSQQPPRTS